MAMKRYFGRFGGRIAGIPNWRGGVFITGNERIQRKIEGHPFFVSGLITLESDDVLAQPRPTDVDQPESWEEYVKGLTYKELQQLASDRGVRSVGVKAVELVEQLVELGE
jgi:hypothetical protein